VTFVARNVLTDEEYDVLGPVAVRGVVETPWGPAWAEVGTYVLTSRSRPDEKVIVAGEDFLRLHVRLPA
jgi:hypothetical protein